MYSRDDLYSLQASLNNLLLLKTAHLAGVDMKVFHQHDYQVSVDFGMDHSWDLFCTVIDNIFEEWESFSPYWGDEDENKEELEEKKYWLTLAGYQEKDMFTSLGTIVVLDDQVQPFETKGIPGNSLYGYYEGIVDIVPIDKGAILIYDEDYGMIDLTETLYVLLDQTGFLSLREEGENIEMAV